VSGILDLLGLAEADLGALVEDLPSRPPELRPRPNAALRSAIDWRSRVRHAVAEMEDQDAAAVALGWADRKVQEAVEASPPRRGRRARRLDHEELVEAFFTEGVPAYAPEIDTIDQIRREEAYGNTMRREWLTEALKQQQEEEETWE
jgi:hypothetical protein